LGGDTSSNASIVGGMIGAYVGVQNMPKKMLHSLLSFSPVDDLIKKERPHEWNVSKRLLPNIQLLLDTRVDTTVEIKEDRGTCRE